MAFLRKFIITKAILFYVLTQPNGEGDFVSQKVCSASSGKTQKLFGLILTALITRHV